MCLRATLRRGTRPTTVESSSRISTHGVARAHQRLARLEHERLDLLAAHPEHRSDLRVGLVAELEEDQRRALVVGQALQLVHQLAQVGAELDLGRHPLERSEVGRQPVGRDLHTLRAMDRQAAVARDRVEPGAQLDVAHAGAQRAVGRGEAVLQGVLGLLAAAEHLSAEGEQAAVVAVVDDLERGVVAGAHARDEAIVAHARQPPRTRGAWGTDVNRGGAHRGKYAPPAQGNVKGVRGQVSRTSRHGMGGNRPGARDRAPTPVGAVATGRMRPCTDTVRPTRASWCTLRPNLERRPDRRQLPRACSCPGRCPPNAGLIHDRTAQPSCGCPHKEERRALTKVGRGSCPNTTRR
jgi:hypothetical protein